MDIFLITIIAGMGLVLGALLALFIVSTIVYTRKDDTDPKVGRSGMRVFTDHKTGLQYLSNGYVGGGLFPRFNADGSHMRSGDPVKFHAE